MGYHVHPIRAAVGSLHGVQRFGGLVLLCLLSFWLFAYTPAAHAVTLPFSDNFNNGLKSDWRVQDQDNRNGSGYDTRNNRLRMTVFGVSLNEYYTVYVDAVSGNFTATIQLQRLNDAGSGSRSGIIVQNNLGSASNNSAHIEVSANQNSGTYHMEFDDDGGGVADNSFAISGTVNPSNVWLKLERNGNVYTGSYKTSTNGSWTTIGTVTSANTASSVDVGLFGRSGDAQRSSRPRFDNFSTLEIAATYTYYLDSDGDTYGDPDNAITSTNASPPSGYVTNNTDCDDTDADINPGETEICDGKDNDCNGIIDDTPAGTPLTTYYRDADGDGYGTNLDTYQGCGSRNGYVATGSDCNDNNPNIHPGASDICGNGIDEDCSGADATCYDDTICEPIADTPLSITVSASPGIIMFILDDSGSMAWSVMCPEDEGRFNGNSYYTNSYPRSRWKSQYHGYNRIYYNPNATYVPWPDSSANTFSDASFTSAPNHPIGFSSGSRNLTGYFTSLGGRSITYGHYYVVSTTDSKPYLVDLGTSSVSYYRVTSYGSGDHGQVTALSAPLTTPPSDVKIPQASLAAARTNFANWYTYSSRRETATKTALGLAIEDLSGVKVGIHTLNHSVIEEATLVSDKADAKAFLTNVYKVKRSGYTPLRRALEDVGQYFDADDGNNGGIGDSPFDTSANGGDCQQAFAILMTDGYGNGYAPNVGNADADNNTDWDGDSAQAATDSEFYGVHSNRLPDVAMHYYERDLSTSLADLVPMRDEDYEADHQRMITYTVSFGVQGDLDPSAYTTTCPPMPGVAIDCPDWPTTLTNEALVDELWQAAVAGRGKYINTGTPQELSDAINTVLTDIAITTGTAASVAVSSEKLDTGLVIYQGSFDSTDWSGNLEAYDVDSSGVVDTNAKWSAQTQVDAADWSSGRTILTRNDTTNATIAFRNRSLLSAAQQTYVTQNQINYLRGDNSQEGVSGGVYRNRNSKLGDITHSSPILHKDVVYVGANDGMFHAFDAATGDELFAYVPTFVFPNLGEYTSPNYTHKYYADGTATAKTVGSTDWVVSGLRKGGRGLFGINVTSPKAIKENALPTIWEYPTTAVPDDDMGYTFGEVTIAEGNDTSAAGQLIFAANGYDSPNGHAVLVILKLDGTLFKKIDTGVGSSTPGNCNGLSDPLVVDLDDDGKADVVYAGDLLGNLWKFDISDTSKANWDVAYKTGTDSKPLFTARNSTGQVQPITTKPAAMFHCDPRNKGTIVVFGTGRMLSDADLFNTNVQTIYGIWDWQEEWDDQGKNGEEYHMGIFNSPSSGKLSNIEALVSSSKLPSGLGLLQQIQADSAQTGWRETTSYAINWFSPESFLSFGGGTPYTGGTHIGWFLNLPDSKERVITKTQIRDGKAFVVSIIPEPAVCSSGGTTVGSIISACNGGQLTSPQWDTNNDGVVDNNDSNYSSKKFDDDIYYAPAIIEDKLFFTKDTVEDTADETRGLFYWRIRE